MTTQSDPSQRHSASRFIDADPGAVYAAFVTADALAAWLPPEGATAQVTAFEPRPGGAFRMTLTFATATGKSSENSDEVDASFVELVPDERIVQAIRFVSDQPEFAGTMTMRWNLEPRPGGTLVTCTADDVPRGIDRDDHEAAIASSLANLARFVEAG